MGFFGDDGPWLTPPAVTLGFIVLGSVWVVLADWAVTSAFGSSTLSARAQLLEGLLFVAGSGAFVYVLLTWRDRAIRSRGETIREDRSAIRGARSDAGETGELLSVVLGNVVDTVLLTDEEGRFTYVCPNVHFIFGYTPEEVGELGTVGALLGDDVPVDEVGDGRVIENIEREVVDSEGRPHNVLVTVKSVDTAWGSILYSVRDVTERKAQEDRFKAYVENSSDVFTVLDERRVVEYVSPAVERVLGYDPDDLIGQNALDLVHADDREALIDVLDEMEERPPGTTISRQYRTRHADGSWVWTESRLTAHGGDAVGEYVINTRDVTELREREGRLSVLDRVLRHNIRNKLNIVLGNARQLEDTVGPDAGEEIEGIVDAAESLLRLSEKARRFDASIRRSEGAVEPVDLVATARRVLGEKRAEYPDVEFLTSFPAEARAEAHEAFELALAELVDNAVVHAGDGDPTVEVGVEVQGATATVRIADRGPGLPEMDREVVLKGEETPLEHGMNIGLWLVRWTIDNSGGSLDVRENTPSGTEVVLRLPLAAGQESR